MMQANATNHSTKRVRLIADRLRSHLGLVPKWQADYFGRDDGQNAKSVLFAAENVTDAVEEVRARMASTCARAKLTRLDGDLTTIIVLPLILDIQEGNYGLGPGTPRQVQEDATAEKIEETERAKRRN
jgi:hypothetical protein